MLSEFVTSANLIRYDHTITATLGDQQPAMLVYAEFTVRHWQAYNFFKIKGCSLLKSYGKRSENGWANTR
jgi:hypothetical protein